MFKQTQRNTPKIIGVGFHKTGTTSLAEALKILGYRVKGVTPRALIPILRGKYSRVLKMVESYDALEDSPWFIIYKELDEYLPGSKFILTIREEENWFRSLGKHSGNIRTAQREWIYGRGNGIPSDNKENTISTYNKHNLEVVNYFKNRQSDLLVLDLSKGDQWTKICKFLDKDIPSVAFPHKNDSRESKKAKTFRFQFRIIKVKAVNFFKIIFIRLLNLDRK